MKDLSKSILTGEPLVPIFSLGEMCISDFVEPTETECKKYPLDVGFDKETGLVQLMSQPDSSLMWGEKYWYKSGTNEFMRNALKDVVESAVKFKKKVGGVWLDIASNDGTLLSQVPKDFTKIGIDPSAYEESYSSSDLIIKDYFSKDCYFNALSQKSDVVTCCAMFYDLQEPVAFLKDVYSVMSEDGIFVLQLSYTPAMLKQLEVGNVLHEHVAYYTFNSLKYALKASGFKVEDVELNNVNGGSIRVYASKAESGVDFKTQADRDIAEIRIAALEAFEEKSKSNSIENYQEFYKSMVLERENFLNFLKQENASGKVFYGYGASSKGNTVLQWYGLTSKDIVKIADKQGRKSGLLCSGSLIPVCSEEQAREEMPDYMVVFPWHFIGEFLERERDYINKGGKLVVLSPKFQVFGK